MASQSDLTAEYPGPSGTSTANESVLTQPYYQPSDPSEFKRLIVKIARQLGDKEKETICFIYSDELGPDREKMTGLNMLDKLQKAGVFDAQNVIPLVKLLRDDCCRHDIVKVLEPYLKKHAGELQEDPLDVSNDERPRKKPKLDNSVEEFDVSDVDRECSNANIHGILVYVTPIRPTVKNPDRKYFYAEITDGKETLKFVCFNTALQSVVAKMKQKKKPCTIKNCAIKQSTYPPTAGDFELHHTAKTKVMANPSKKFDIPDDFIYTPTRVLDQLNDLKNIMKGQSVTVCGKILIMTDPVEVQNSLGSKLQKQDCILADRGMAVPLKIWEGDIGKIRNGRCYQFINIKMKQYQGERFLTTTEDSKFEEIDDIGKVTMEKKLPNTHREIRGRIVMVVSKYKACPSKTCNSAKVDPDSSKCSNCNGSVNPSSCKDEVYAKFTVQDESKLPHDVTAFTGMLTLIIGSDQTLSSLSEIEIKRLLRQSDPALFKVNERNVIVTVER